jgi:hypothetical protein
MKRILILTGMIGFLHCSYAQKNVVTFCNPIDVNPLIPEEPLSYGKKTTLPQAI